MMKLRLNLKFGLFLIGCQALAMPTFASLTSGPRDAGLTNERPEILADVGITENLGEKVNLELGFKDENGKGVKLRDFFSNGRPVLFDLAYYSCPSLCNIHLNGVFDALKKMAWTPGSEFEFVVVSFNSKDTPEIAKAKKENYLKQYGRTGAVGGVHFLTGADPEIKELARQIGFAFKWDAAANQFAHASSAYVLSPSGQISRYLKGIVFDPQTLRLSLAEAADGKVVTVIDTLMLYCFHYDTKASKYTLAVMNVVRGASLLTVALMILFLGPYWTRQYRAMRGREGSGV